MRPVRIHTLRGNKAERSPHRLFIWDTETDPQREPRREVHQLRIWAAETVQRHGRRPKQPAVQAHQGRTTAELADAITGACRSSETVWAFAHNQSFDLAATRLPLQLLERGWVVTAHAMATASPWARLARGSHRLVLADSTSWLPGPLAGIGDQVGIAKPELPEWEAGDGDWWQRCRQDVAILRLAICQLLDWWDQHKMGSWSITGPQSGFNAMRHRPTPHTVTIDPDPDARSFERSAIMAGRREVWRVGELPWSDYREIDFRMAHATIAAHCALPKRRSVHFDGLDLGDWRLDSERWSVLARVALNATSPRYPLQLGGRIWYPVGRFETVLCGPEIAEARRRGELLKVGPGYVYQLGAHMSWWGAWVLDQLSGAHPETPEVALTAIKAWSRQVPGKWAARTGRLLHCGLAAERGWALEHGRHHPSGAPVSVFDMAGRREVVLQDQDADDCFPAVLAWIQSHVRVRLGRLIDAIGPPAMVSANTDGVVYDHTRWALGGCQAADVAPLEAREKARYARITAISPQHMILDGRRRLSGVPAGADEVGPLQYHWMTWPRMASQLAEGDRRGYLRKTRTADLRNVPVNRWVTAEGLCLPVQAELGEDGGTRLLAPGPDLSGADSVALRERQHPLLARLLSSEAR